MGHWNRITRGRSRTKLLLEGFTAEESIMKGRHPVDGEALTAREIIDRLEKSRHAHDYVGMCRAVLSYAMAVRDEQLDREQKFQESLTEMLGQLVGPDWKRLAKFGITPQKERRRLTSEELVIAHARSLKTRRTRGTKGPKQREEITTEPQPEVKVIGLPNPKPCDTTGS